MKIEIRRINERDWKSLKNIRLESLSESASAFGSTFDDESKEPDQYWVDWSFRASGSNTLATFFAFANQNIVGVGGGKTNREEVEIVAMWVNPSHRGLGIGKQIIESIQDHFRATKYSLWVNTENKSAISLYHKSGFRDTGIRERLVRDPKIIEMKMGR